MQQQLALAIEKERSATEIADELKAKCKALETEYRRIKQEKSMCDEILEEEQSKRKSIEEILKRFFSFLTFFFFNFSYNLLNLFASKNYHFTNKINFYFY